MSKEVFVIRIPPSLDRRIDRAADLYFDGRSEIVRRAASIGLALIRDKNWECSDHLTFEDRTVRLAVRVTLRLG
jgi:metal-responsive CopG/Arc/MetJ family transcriptional regulator